MNQSEGIWGASGKPGRKLRPTWRQLFLLPFPRFLSGFRLGDWFKLLRAHRFRIDRPFWPRAVLATLGCAVTSCLARLEHLCARGEVDPELWEKPVFILGLPRSGTSHLFELLAQSPHLCFPTRFDAFKPHTFLSLRRAGLFAVLSKLPRFKRAMDNVHIGWGWRSVDSISLPGGRKVFWPFFHTLVGDRVDLSRWRVVQTSPANLLLEVQALPGREVDTGELRRYLVAKLPAELSLEVRCVDLFEVPPGAKFRVVVAFRGGSV